MRSWVEQLAIPAGLFLAACGGNPEEPEPIDIDDVTSLEERPCPDDSYLTYENFGGPFILSWCNGCHSSALPEGERQGAPVSSNFDSLDDIRAVSGRIWDRSADHNVTMPPAGGPEEDERALLGEWLACGAPADDD